MTTQKRAFRKGILIAEIIVCYMAALAVVSYARGPERYRVDEAPLLCSEIFVSAVDNTPAEAGGVLRFDNGTAGQVAGYNGALPLSGVKGIRISFQINCPEQYAGRTLTADLYNFEAGYDDPAQEFSLTLQPGLNQAVFSLDPGPAAPEKALLRFFTLDDAGYSLEQLEIHRMQALPRVPDGLWIGLGACFLLLAGTAVYFGCCRKARRTEAGPA